MKSTALSIPENKFEKRFRKKIEPEAETAMQSGIFTGSYKNGKFSFYYKKRRFKNCLTPVLKGKVKNNEIIYTISRNPVYICLLFFTLLIPAGGVATSLLLEYYGTAFVIFLEMAVQGAAVYMLSFFVSPRLKKKLEKKLQEIAAP